MNRLLKGVCILVLAGLAAGSLACKNPRTSKAAQLGPAGPTHSMASLGAMENAGAAGAMPTVLARALVTKDGEVIGILFSTPDGDFCESRDGHPTGMVSAGWARKHPM